jgi:hypothetical protein
MWEKIKVAWNKFRYRKLSWLPMVSGHVSYTQSELHKILQAGFLPAIFEPTQVFPYNRGDFLVFKINRKIPHHIKHNLEVNFNAALKSIGLRGIFLPGDIDLVGRVSQDESGANGEGA